MLAFQSTRMAADTGHRTVDAMTRTPAVTCSIRLTITPAMSDREQTQVVCDLEGLPPGTHVTLEVGDTWPTPRAVWLTAEIVSRLGLHLQVTGTPSGIRAWVPDLRAQLRTELLGGPH